MGQFNIKGYIMSSIFYKIFQDREILYHECDGVPLNLLESALKNFTSVVEERREKDSIRNEKISQYLKQLEADGIDPTELIPNYHLGASSLTKSKRPKRPAKYQYTLPSGETKTWTGQGRTPLPIQEHLDQGGSMDDFLI